MSVILMAGCCCGLKRRGPFDNDVVAAREMSRLGLDAMHRDSLVEAQARFSKALETCPDDVNSRCNLARVLWRRCKSDAAIEEMDSAIRSSGGDPAWTVELGQMLLARKQYATALECANRALETDRDLPPAWRLQAEVYQATNRPAEALQAYHRALSNGDESAVVLTQIAESYRAAGRPRRALSTLQRLEDELPVEEHPDRLSYWQGLALQQLGRHEDAVERLLVAKNTLGDDPELLFILAESQMKAGMTAAANETIQLANRLQPADKAMSKLASETEQKTGVAQVGYSESVQPDQAHNRYN